MSNITIIVNSGTNLLSLFILTQILIKVLHKILILILDFQKCLDIVRFFITNINKNIRVMIIKKLKLPLIKLKYIKSLKYN